MITFYATVTGFTTKTNEMTGQDEITTIITKDLSLTEDGDIIYPDTPVYWPISQVGQHEIIDTQSNLTKLSVPEWLWSNKKKEWTIEMTSVVNTDELISQLSNLEFVPTGSMS